MKTIPAWRDDIKPEYQSIIQIAAPAMQAEIDALRTRLAEVEKDAARYQWLRLNYDDSLVMVGGDKGCAELYMEEELDAAIDAAMEQA